MTTARLSPTSAAGMRWGLFVGEAQPFLSSGSDPWRFYTLDLAGAKLMPGGLSGPAIYACLGSGEWQYVGQTVRPVGDRLVGHSHDQHPARRRAKRSSWHGLCVAQLDPRYVGELGRLERLAHDLLQPRMGSRWPMQKSGVAATCRGE